MGERGFTIDSRKQRIVSREHQTPPLTETIEMSNPSEKEIVRIDLTNEQKEQVKAATEKNAEAIELTVQELEARIAPFTGLGSPEE
jgi:hypothetical protein